MKNKIEDALNSDDAFEEFEKLQEIYVILVNGKRIKTRSGKTFWPSLGGAKSALRIHIENLLIIKNYKLSDYVTVDETDKPNWHELKMKEREIIQGWIDNHVLFVPFDHYMQAFRKRTQ